MKIVPIFSSPAGAGGPILNYLWDVRVTRSCARVTMTQGESMKPYQSTATYCWALIIIMPVKLVIHHEPQKKDPVQNWDLWQVALLLALAQQSLIKSPESQISQKSSTFKIHEPVFPMTMTTTRHKPRGTCVLQIAIYVEYRCSSKSCIVALWILRALFDKPCIETTGSDKSCNSTCFFQF